MPHLGDIKNIDESVSDIYNIQEYIPSPCETSTQQANFDEIVTVKVTKDPILRCEDNINIKRINETSEQNKMTLLIPHETKPVNRLYGSTRHLFQKQIMKENSEETTFLLSVPSVRKSEDNKIPIPKHDSQESVQRIITERRKLDENLKDIDKYDIFEVTRKESDENSTVAKGQRGKGSTEGDSQC